MHKVIIAALLALGLVGCATTAHYGNYAPPTTKGGQQKLAREAVQQLATLYPPAKTRLELQQATPDAFGQALVPALRESGYALLESNTGRPKAQSSASTLPLRYVLDQAGDANLYRLTLLVGNQSISRPYLVSDGNFVPAGYWAHRE